MADSVIQRQISIQCWPRSSDFLVLSFTPRPAGTMYQAHTPLQPSQAKSFDYSDDNGIRESFLVFSLKAHELDKQLGKFANDCAVRLGRVAALLLAIKSTREALKRSREVFFRNAIALVPVLFEHARKDSEQFYILPQYFNESLPPFDELPTVLEELAASFQLLRVRIDEFREFTDEGLLLKSLLLTLDRDLMYRASCARFYSDRLNTPLIQRYIHEFTSDFQVDFDKVTAAIGEFAVVGVSAINHEQARSSANLTNTLTVSTFFSGVTATTLQMSISATNQNNAVLWTNLLWFMSMIFSVGAALNSLLAMVWTATLSGSRGGKLSFWATMWIDRSQLVFLGISIVTFSAGLIVFVFASSQAWYTPYFAVGSLIVTSIGLGIVPVLWISYQMQLSPVLRLLADVIQSSGDSDHSESSNISSISGSIADVITNALPFLRFKPQDDLSHDDVEELDERYSKPEELQTQEYNSKMMLKDAVKHVGMINSTLGTLAAAGQHNKRRRYYDMRRRGYYEKQQPSKAKLQIEGSSTTVPFTELTLSNEPISMIEFARYGTICDVAYSDDGKFLAITCAKKHVMQSWTGILDAETLTIIMDAWHEGQVISEHLKWSPSGKKIIVKFEHRFDVWRLDAKILRPIERNHTVQDVAWFGDDAFLVAEDNRVFKMNLRQQIMAVYRFDHAHIRSIGLMRNSDYLVLITRVARSLEQFEPASGRSEKRIVIYDMDKEEEIYQVPVLHEEIFRIYPIAGELDMLITHKDQKAFQLWSLDAGIRGSEITAKLKKRPITPHDNPGDYTGPTCIGGNYNQFVLNVTTSGGIDMWRRESGVPYQRFQSSILQEEGVHCLSWRRSNDETATFATAGIDSHTLLVWRGKELRLPKMPVAGTEPPSPASAWSGKSRSRWQRAVQIAAAPSSVSLSPDETDQMK